jgi:hypothetical protein
MQVFMWKMRISHDSFGCPIFRQSQLGFKKRWLHFSQLVAGQGQELITSVPERTNSQQNPGKKLPWLVLVENHGQPFKLFVFNP